MYANKKRTHATIMYAVCKLLSYNMYHYCSFTASSFPLPQHYRNSKPITAVKPQLSSPLPQDLPWFYHGEIPPVTLSAVNNNGKKYWQYQYLLIKVLAIPVPTLFLKSIAIPILYQNRNCRPHYRRIYHGFTVGKFPMLLSVLLTIMEKSIGNTNTDTY